MFFSPISKRSKSQACTALGAQRKRQLDHSMENVQLTEWLACRPAEKLRLYQFVARIARPSDRSASSSFGSARRTRVAASWLVRRASCHEVRCSGRVRGRVLGSGSNMLEPQHPCCSWPSKISISSATHSSCGVTCCFCWHWDLELRVKAAFVLLAYAQRVGLPLHNAARHRGFPRKLPSRWRWWGASSFPNIGYPSQRKLYMTRYVLLCHRTKGMRFASHCFAFLQPLAQLCICWLGTAAFFGTQQKKRNIWFTFRMIMQIIQLTKQQIDLYQLQSNLRSLATCYY